MAKVSDLERCPWAGESPEMQAYHDDEWGVPLRDGRRLFGLLVLEGAQAGLSWSTILRKREGYLRAMDGLDPDAIAGYDAARIDALLQDPGIVRNRAKVRSAVQNARAHQRVCAEEGDFGAYVWSFVGGEPQLPDRPLYAREVRSTSPEGDLLSEDLLRRGFSFVGPTIVYAFMQSAGLVDDHAVGCHKYRGPLAEPPRPM